MRKYQSCFACSLLLFSVFNSSNAAERKTKSADDATSQPASEQELSPEKLAKHIRQEFALIRKLLETKDVGMAIVVRDRLEKQISPNDKESLSRLAGISKQLEGHIQKQDIKVTDDSVFVPRPPQNTRWKAALMKGQGILAREAQSPQHSGVGVVRVRMEDATREEALGVRTVQLDHFLIPGGYGGYEWMRDGDFIFTGKSGGTGPQFGEIWVEALAHRAAKVEIEVPEKKVAAAGELIVKAIPKSECGHLRIRVEPESGLSLNGTRVHVGRKHGGYQGGVVLPPNRTCLFEYIAPGEVDAYAESKDVFATAHDKVQIEAGKTTDLLIKAYIPREVLFEWRYRPSGKSEWSTGTSVVQTGQSGPLNSWGQQGAAYHLSPWTGETAGIKGMNGRLAPVDRKLFEDADPIVPLDEVRRTKREEFPLELGGVYGVSFNTGLALLRVKGITRATQSRALK